MKLISFSRPPAMHLILYSTKDAAEHDHVDDDDDGDDVLSVSMTEL